MQVTRNTVLNQSRTGATSPLSGPGLSFFAGYQAFRLSRRTQNVCAAAPSTATPSRKMIQTIPCRSSEVDFWIGFWVKSEGEEEGRRKKEEGRGQARSACTYYATPTDSPRRLVLGTYGLALSTIVQGMLALCHFLPLSHTNLTYATSAQPCVIATNRYDQKNTLVETLYAHRSQGARRQDPATEPPHHDCRSL